MSNAIASGRKNPDSAIGIYAGDAQSYDTFAPVFDPIISDYHHISNKKHSSDIRPLTLPELDPKGDHIRSTRIRVARNLDGFSFPCHISGSQRGKLERKIKAALLSLTGNLKGEYVSLEQVDTKEFQRLKKANLIFGKGDRFQEAAGINSHFPKHRGVFVSFDKQFIVWVNEEDHMRVISLEKTSNISSVFNRLSRALFLLNSSLDFAWNKTYGNLTSCPTNIGTAMRAGVHIHLKKLAQKKELLLDLTRSYNLQIRGTSGEKTPVEHGVFDISNRQRLGLSESSIIRNLHRGLLAIIRTEKQL